MKKKLCQPSVVIHGIPQERILVISIFFVLALFACLKYCFSDAEIVRKSKIQKGAWSRIQHQTNLTKTVVLMGRKKTQRLGVVVVWPNFQQQRDSLFYYYYYYCLELQ